MSDLISRQAAIDEANAWLLDCFHVQKQDMSCGLIRRLEDLPSTQPEYRLDEWCTDCKEYDKERHCCPRWNRVIRDTLQDVQPERKTGRWIYGEDEHCIDGYHCDKCGFFVPWDYVHKFINYIEDYNFCPNCGAKMKQEAEDETD